MAKATAWRGDAREVTEEKRREGVRGRWEPALDVGGDGTLQGAATRKRAGG